MALALNGWRRLGLFLAVTWMLGVVGFVTIEALPSAQGFAQGAFVSHAIPAGTTIQDGKVTLPDGKVVQIDNHDPASGRQLDPWEIDWSKQHDVPKSIDFHVMRFALVAFVLPLGLWLAIEIICAAFRWVARGFRSNRS